jgi:hypothetical protein
MIKYIKCINNFEVDLELERIYQVYKTNRFGHFMIYKDDRIVYGPYNKNRFIDITRDKKLDRIL